MKIFQRLSTAFLLFLLMAGCSPPPSNTDPDTQNPYPPYAWDPFTNWNMLNPSGNGERTPVEGYAYSKSGMEDSLLTCKSRNPQCPSRVVSLNVYLTNAVRGNLKFNEDARLGHGANYGPGLNNNTTLGPYNKGHSEFYKFEVEVVFEVPAGCFYGQLISDANLTANLANAKPEFSGDGPANQWANILPGAGAQNPVVESSTSPVAGKEQTTVRWIDAPQGMPLANDVTKFAWIYAGSCGKITDEAVVEITYHRNGAPTASLLTGQQFKARVKGWKFK